MPADFASGGAEEGGGGTGAALGIAGGSTGLGGTGAGGGGASCGTTGGGTGGDTEGDTGGDTGSSGALAIAAASGSTPSGTAGDGTGGGGVTAEDDRDRAAWSCRAMSDRTPGSTDLRSDGNARLGAGRAGSASTADPSGLRSEAGPGRGSTSGGAVRLRIRRGVVGSRAGGAGSSTGGGTSRSGEGGGGAAVRGGGNILTGLVAAEQRRIEGQRDGRGGGGARDRRRHDHRHLEARIEQRFRAAPAGFGQDPGRFGQATALDEGIRERLVQRLGGRLRPDGRFGQRPLAALDVALDHDVVGAAHEQQVLDIVPAQQDQLPGAVEFVHVDDPQPRLAPTASGTPRQRQAPAGEPTHREHDGRERREDDGEDHDVLDDRGAVRAEHGL